MVLNPGRQLLEASQTAIVVGTTQAAVDAVLQQHYSEPASPAAVHADAANQVHWYLVVQKACMPGLATTSGVTGCNKHISATLSLCALHAKLHCVQLLNKVVFAPCIIGSLPSTRIAG